MAQLLTTRNYDDGEVLTRADLDAFLDDIETFINTTRINDDNIQNSGINGAQKLLNQSVTEPKIASNAITAAKITTDAVTTTKIMDSAVTTTKIADLNVTTAKINDLAVTTGKINDDAVTNAKLADNSVNTLQLINASVTTPKLDNLAVTRPKVVVNWLETTATLSGTVGASNQVATFANFTATGGRLVRLTFTAGQIDGSAGGIPSGAVYEIRIERDGGALVTYTIQIAPGATIPVRFPLGGARTWTLADFVSIGGVTSLRESLGGVTWIDSGAAAGVRVYSIQVRRISGGGSWVLTSSNISPLIEEL